MGFGKSDHRKEEEYLSKPEVENSVINRLESADLSAMSEPPIS